MIKIANGLGIKLFSDLEIGDTFLYHGDLFIKTDNDCGVLNLSLEGTRDNFLLLDEEVMPVDIEIKVIRKEKF